MSRDNLQKGSSLSAPTARNLTPNATQNRAKLLFSRFDGKHDNTPKGVSMAWPQLVAMLSERELRQKKDGPLFSGASYPQGKTRGNENAACVSLAILDFDNGASLDFLEARAREMGICAAIYSTFSHTPSAPKFRLVAPFSSPVAASDWPDTWQRLNAAFDGKADRAAKDAARIHYLPSCPPETSGDAIFVSIDGAPLDVSILPLLDADKAPEMPANARFDMGADRYAQKVFENELGRVLTAQNGNRNTTLNNSALALGHLVGAGRLSRGDVENALENAACSIGLSQGEARATIKSGLDKGEQEPNERGKPLGGERPKTNASAARNTVFPCTDAGNGERFAFHNFERVRYVSQWKKWLVWNGRFWERDETDAALNLAKETARQIPSEAKGATGDKYTAILKHAIASEGAARLHAMLDLARSEPGMTIRARELDANEWLFNVQNGTLDLKAGEYGAFRPHSREDFLTKVSPVSFDPDATAPQWEKFLREIFGGSEALVRYFARVVGYSLTGDTREQILLVLHGSGSNGKSLLLRVLARLFGDYSHTMEPATICQKYGDKMATDVAELFGKRFVVSSETNDGRRLDEGMVKRMTGGEELTGERKFEAPFTFTPQFQIFFCTNHKPEIRGTDNGIWRRVQLVPFNVTFWSQEKGESGPPELRADSGLFEKLEAELPGILNWALEGFADYRANGLGTPDEVKAATADYRAEMDKLGDFFRERCFVTKSASVPSGELYRAFCDWAEKNGEPKQSQQIFGRKMRERGFFKDENNKKRPYLGIGILEENPN